MGIIIGDSAEPPIIHRKIDREILLDKIAKFMIKMGFDYDLSYDGIYSLLSEIILKKRLYWE